MSSPIEPIEPTEPTGRATIQLTSDGLDRPYLLQAPPNAGADGLPLLVELHGRGIDAVRFDTVTGFGALAAECGFALALPSAVDEIWNDGRVPTTEGDGRPDDVGYIAAVVDDAIARLPIDPRRVYIVGMSNGAAMAGRLACELAERIAAIAQVGGTAAARVAARSRPSCPVPILNIHGTADPHAPYEGGIRHSLRGRLMLRHGFGPAVGVDDWARFWVAANGAIRDAAVSAIPPDTTIRTWRRPSASSDVVFYRIDGGGHTWPGGRWWMPAFLFGRTSVTFDATRVIWDFLASHRRP
ncbi:MAG: PHB depolymerase family esterase [Candidatus Limnocylindrales bacterium]|jgi:polyhydroxybutyrate depolymerase